MRARGGGRRPRALAALCAAALLLAAAPAAAQEPVPKDETSAEAPKESSFRWVFSWRGWDGLYMELSQKTGLGPAPAVSGQEPPDTWQVPVLSLEEVKLSGRVGARLEGDAAAFATSSSLTGFDGGVDLRRARLVLAGDSIVLVPFRYKIEVGYVPNVFNLSSAWIAIPDIAYVGTLQGGQFQPPQGLDVIQSSLALPLMEPAAPIQAIAPGTEAGLQVGRPVFGGRATWTLGLFGNGAGQSEYGSATKGYGNVIGRATFLAIEPPRDADASPNRLLHVGLSLGCQFASTGTIRYRSRPESYIAPYVVDTGPITSSGVETVGLEAAWVNGPFYAQAEGIHSYVQESGGTSLGFGGFYAIASWALTGESRAYDREAGAVRRIVPRREFRFGKGEGRGALEVSIRYSYTDLNDKFVHGGRLSLLMSGLTWTPLLHVRWLFNAGYGTVTGGAADGHMAIFQTRIGVDL
ncbi:MAG TPA: porin [Thermoanaerobaculia bacterium]|nr:porin [Thermoanaerobaculia bacterium]HQR65819.1 porin [Thermoanaerobaculia bacterium]